MDCDEAIESLAGDFDRIRRQLLDVEWDCERNMSGPLAELSALRRDVNNLLTELYGEIDSLYESLQEHGGA
jgi:hypothetical protein